MNQRLHQIVTMPVVLDDPEGAGKPPAPEEQREPLRRAHAAEERARLIIDSVRDYAIFMLSPEGRIETWNQGATCLKGYTTKEVIGQPMSRFYTPEDVRDGKPLRLLRRARDEGSVVDEGWRVHKDGRRFWASVVISAIRDEAGNLLGFAKVTRDLTEHKQSEEERMRLAQAEEAVRLRDEFLSIAAHELKTPLTALNLQLQSVRRQVARIDAATVERLDRALRSSERLTQLIETLLDVSRITSGRLTLIRERTELSEQVREVVERFQEEARRASSPLSCDAGPPLTANADRLRLDQVLSNLLSNAVKFGAGTAIQVTLRQEGDTAIFTVEDGGPGIPPADLERIFERFEQVSPEGHYGGVGLGLYIARQIVEGHGGTLIANNRAQGGACFTARIPLSA